MKPLGHALGSLPGASLFAARFLALFALAASLGCSSHSPQAGLVIINGKEPESLDPAIFTGQSDGRLGLALFEGLTRYHPVDATAEPGLAESWTLSEDHRTYRFLLRTNAMWSTGDAITAHDFEWTWRRVIEPETACDYAGILFFVKNAEDYGTARLKDFGQVGFRALDARTFEVVLTHPTPFFLELCAYPTLAVLPRRTIEQHGDRWLKSRPLPCSGAFELVSWRVNDRVRLRRNNRYWDAANTRTEWVDLLSVSHPNTALNLYETGAADIIWDKDLIPTEVLDLLKRRRDFHSFEYLATYFLRFNTSRPPFHDSRVRRAFALAIDKARITTRVTRGGERTANQFVPPGLPEYVPPGGLLFDPARARAVLSEAGYPAGQGFPRVEYWFDHHRDHQRIAVELQAMWKQHLGVQVQLRAVEWKVFLPAQSRLEYDICRSSWIGDYNDPTTFLDLFLGSNPNNRTGWKHDSYDQMIRQAHAEARPEIRRQLLQEAERLLVESEVPIAPLYFYTGYNFWDPDRVEGIHNNLRDEHPLRTIARRPMAERAQP